MVTDVSQHSLFDSSNALGGLPIKVEGERNAVAKADPFAGLSMQPAPGPAIGGHLRTLCGGYERAFGKQPRRSPGGSKVHDALEQTLEGHPGTKANRLGHLPKDRVSLCEALGTHRGPVILLDPNGHPKYAFEWKDNAWHAYDARTFARLPAHQQTSPADMVTSMFTGSAQGLYFSAFRIDGWKASHEPGSDEPLVVYPDPVEGDRSDTLSQLIERERRTGTPSSEDEGGRDDTV